MLKTRVMTAAVLLAGFVSALYLLPRNGWVAFCAVFLGLSAWEWGALAALAAVGRLIYSTFLVGFFVLPGILEASAANGSYSPAGASGNVSSRHPSAPGKPGKALPGRSRQSGSTRSHGQA